MNNVSSQHPEALAQGEAGLAPLRVLLLDDDVFMLDVLSDMLEQLGQFDIRCESHSEQALSTLKQHQPDLLICDLSMPDIDGIEFLRMAADNGFRGGVVLLSGLHSAVRLAAERLAVANGLYILGTFRKPMESAELQLMVNMQLQHTARLSHGQGR
ncbi:response regulator [Janthinobacterium sp. BJB1]|uniref:response regulator n=1 Tax=Janthinobacterium sp. GW458P TaxID=1981504 RepID=UPI000A328A4C|nr:response regulator [Janthinobacterium sp. GW458P]MBE3023962.1 response regulator [Janthinobacterium sp. GW458P]PHV18995.1 response regulator [Janthinobacterium sp. BJB303]PJC99466.1 response regulator [Janthinobacterium sp. BJB1]